MGNKPSGNSFIGFVIDETGSMSNEIDAVKTWLTNCVTGSYTDCATPPTGGWILSSFNDPSMIVNLTYLLKLL